MKLFILFLIFLNTSLISYAQKTYGVTIKLISKIPDTIKIKAPGTMKLRIQNLSSESIRVSNVPIQSVNYRVLKKINNRYFSIDSDCVVLIQPQYPKEGMKLVKLQRNAAIIVKVDFPPFCAFFENGNYQIQYLFSYYVGSRLYTIKTNWYSFITQVP